MDTVEPVEDIPERRRGIAPTISIPRLLAAVISIVTGISWLILSPRLCRRLVPAKQDWHPVSAMALKVIIGVGARIDVTTPMSLKSTGRALTVMSIHG